MQSFFDKIKMLPGWRFMGRKDLESSKGAIVQVSDELKLRIFEMTGSGKGGIVEKRYNPTKREFQLKCVIQNATPDAINEFINKNYTL